MPFLSAHGTIGHMAIIFARSSPPQPQLIQPLRMLKQKRENRIVSCLVCWTCRGRMGPNHFTLKDGVAVCRLCQAKNPLGNLRKLSIQEVTTPAEIIVCFTQSGKAAHALHLDCRTALGPWITFASAKTPASKGIGSCIAAPRIKAIPGNAI
jgi:ribosomal protein L40E